LFVLLRYLNLFSSSPSWKAACPFPSFSCIWVAGVFESTNKAEKRPAATENHGKFGGIWWNHMSVAFKLEVHLVKSSILVLIVFDFVFELVEL